MGWYANQKARHEGIGRPVVVKTVRGDGATSKLIEKMTAAGYTLDQQATRGLAGGKHTLTFTLAAKEES